MRTYTEDEIRKILQAESDARLRLKQARAVAFVKWSMNGRGRVADCWQQVALETAELEREFEAASIEKQVVSIMLRLDAMAPSEDGGESP